MPAKIIARIPNYLNSSDVDNKIITRIELCFMSDKTLHIEMLDDNLDLLHSFKCDLTKPLEWYYLHRITEKE